MGNHGKRALENYKSQVQYMLKHGEKKTSEHFGISIESLHRNKRRYFEHIGSESLENKVPKVLIFDLETSLSQVLTFRFFKANIPHDNIQVPSHLHSWAGKWLNEAEVFGDVQTSEEAEKHDDKRITKSLWKVIDEADIIIAHNCNNFDKKVANTRFILNGMKPPSPYSVVDTLLVARKEFRLASNKLDYLGQIMVQDEKIHTDLDLWRGCFGGDEKSLTQMYDYNKQDVLLLEEVYYELRPWIHSHPNMAIYAEANEETCSNCGVSDLSECGNYVTPAGRFDALRCNSCGAILRRRKSTLSKGQRENLLISTAR